MATVAIADRSHTAITEASVPSRCRSAWRRVSLAMRRRSESTDPASWNALLPPVPGAIRESGLCRRPGECVDQVAGLGQHGGRREQDLIVTAEPIGAPGMVLIPPIGRRRQDLGSAAITNSAGYRPKPSASGSPARPDTSVLRRFCSLGYEGARDLTDCPKHPRTYRQGLAGAALAGLSMPPLSSHETPPERS